MHVCEMAPRHIHTLVQYITRAVIVGHSLEYEEGEVHYLCIV